MHLASVGPPQASGFPPPGRYGDRRRGRRRRPALSPKGTTSRSGPAGLSLRSPLASLPVAEITARKLQFPEADRWRREGRPLAGKCVGSHRFSRIRGTDCGAARGRDELSARLFKGIARNHTLTRKVMPHN